MTKVIDSFRGEYKFLSNFYTPAPTMYDGIIYSSSEHAFAAAKTLDLEIRKDIQATLAPSMAKAIGRALELRPDWEGVKIGIMYTIVRDKFIRNSGLQRRLLATGDAELVEGNTWGDKFWGVCDGEGENHHGRILMEIRKELSEEEQDANH